MNAFHYESRQVHFTSMNGKTHRVENIVNIKNGKGTKTVVMSNNGQTKKVSKKLTKDNVKCIRNHQFIPGLFQDCMKTINARLQKSTTRRHTKKRKTPSKK